MTQPTPPPSIKHLFMNWLSNSNQTWFERLLVPVLIFLMVLFTGLRLFASDWLQVGVSLFGIALLASFASFPPLQRLFLGQAFNRSHAFYLSIFWLYSLIAVTVTRILLVTPAFGKESRPFYVFTILLIAVVFRMLFSLFALTPLGYRVCMSKIPFWEQCLIAINEFMAAGLLAFILGGELTQWLQARVFTLQVNVWYSGGLIGAALAYYLLVQAMWIQAWNQWLSKRVVWVTLTRLFAPLALVVASIVITQHFTNLSEARSASLLNTANIDQTILALSPIVWMMIFFVIVIVYTSNRGLRRRLLPDDLLQKLPIRLYNALNTISDMDILMLFGALASLIPLQLFLFNNIGVIGSLQAQLSRQNALIDSSEQALALIFALPFYLLAVALLALYAYVLSRNTVSAQERSQLADLLPIPLLILFIIMLYLAAIPFSQVLTEGRLPRLPQDLAYILAYDVLIPFILFLIHFFVLVRTPYTHGHKKWRIRYEQELANAMQGVRSKIQEVQAHINQAENLWKNRDYLKTGQTERMNMLYELIELNSQRDNLDMERSHLQAEQQNLSQLADAPLALEDVPRQILTYGITLVLFFKIYEWAIVNDGLREVANNPNIGILEFFQTILENTNF